MTKISFKHAESLVAQYSTAIITSTNERKTAICNVGGRYFRVSIMYTYKSVVFTDTKTNETVVKQLV